jgi:hypothetical protein
MNDEKVKGSAGGWQEGKGSGLEAFDWLPRSFVQYFES